MTAPHWVPPDQHAQRMLARIRAAGLTLERRGRGWRVTGPGIDLLVSDLHHLTASDLEPLHEQRHLTAG